MNEFCKVCATSSFGRLYQWNLVRKAGSVREVYGILLDTYCCVDEASSSECLAVAHSSLLHHPGRNWRHTNDDQAGGSSSLGN